MVAHLNRLETERHPRREAQVEILMEAQVAEHGHVDAGRNVGHIAIPLLAVGGDKTIVGELEVLKRHSDRKA